MQTPIGMSFVFRNLWVAPLAWVVLHSLDYYLTLWGAKLYHAGANQVVSFEGSYELNPHFQKAIDQGQYFGPRFLISLGMIGILFAALMWLLGQDETAWPLTSQIGAGVLGVLLFTRLTVIGQHLQSVWLFHVILHHPETIRGHIVYDRPTVYRISFRRFMGTGVLLTAAALLAPSAWIWGGALGHFFVGLSILRWSRRKLKARQVEEVSAVPALEDAETVM